MKVAFVASGTNKTPYSEYVPLARYLKENGHFPFFVLPKSFSKTIANSIMENGIKLFIEDQEVKQKFSVLEQQKLGNRHDNKKQRKGLLKFISRTRLFIRFYYSFKQSKHTIRNVFQIEEPDVVIVYGDRNKELVPATMRLCHDKEIPICLIQVAANNMEFILHSRFDNPDFDPSNFLNLLLNKRSPEQVYTYEGKSYNFFPWYLGWALALNKLLPANPWFDGESWANKCLLISENHLRDAQKDGAKCDNAVITGQYSHDKLFRAYMNRDIEKAEICRKYFNGEDKPLIIYGLPQLIEHGLLSKSETFDSIKTILSGISIEKYNVLISLHPKMQIENYRWIEDKFSNVKIAAGERLNEILPTGEFFISAFESTIPWAIMCGVIPIYTDYYNLGLDVSKYKSCVILKEQEQFHVDFSSLNKALLEQKLSEDQGYLPPFDGKSGARILQELEALVNE